MLARIRKSMEEKDQGFTLIELLVVMIIIGILAAIAIPVFLNQRAKARDTAVKADVSTVGKEIATHYVDNSTVPVVTVAGGELRLDGVKVGNASEGVALKEALATTATPTTWCVSLEHADGAKKVFKYSAANGLQQGTCV